MANQQLLDYIRQQTQTGKSKEEITSALLAAGWQAQDVEQAFVNPNAVPTPTATEIPKSRQILSESWAIYKKRFKTLIGINLIPMLSVFLFSLLIGVLAVTTKASQANLKGPTLAVLIFIGFIVFLGLIYICIWATIAELFAIKDQAEGIGWQEAFKRSKGKIWVFFGTSVLSGLAVLGGLILFIIPGIIFGLWFSQSPYIVIEEGLANTAALKRSKYYVKGRIGQIFGKLFYVGIITFGLYVGLSIILTIFASLVGIKYNNISWISNIFSLIWTPLITVYSYQVYKYCKATRP